MCHLLGAGSVPQLGHGSPIGRVLGHAPICGAEGAILRASYAKRFQAAYHGQVERTEQQERTGVSERAAQELLAELGRRSGRERLGDGR